jgi:hypothetical protein
MMTPPETPSNTGPQKAMRGLYVAIPTPLYEAVKDAAARERLLLRHIVEDALLRHLAYLEQLPEKGRR